MIGCKEAYTFWMKVWETAGVTAREAAQKAQRLGSM
jgi:hypothetical protein